MEGRGQLHVPAALSPVRIHVPIESVTWAAELILTLWRREKYSALAGIQNPDRPAYSLITIPTRVITCMTGSYTCKKLLPLFASEKK